MEWEAKYCKAKGKVLGEKTNSFTNIRDPKLMKILTGFVHEENLPFILWQHSKQKGQIMRRTTKNWQQKNS